MGFDDLRLQFDRRPLLVFGAGLVVGLTAVAHPWNLLVLLPGLAGLQRIAMRAVMAAALIVGLFLAPVEPRSVQGRTYVDAVGTVVSVPHPSPFGTTFNLATNDRTWRVSSNSGLLAGLGDRLEVAGVGLPLQEGSDSYFLLHGVSGRLEAAKVTLLSPGPWPWRLASAWRSDFRRFCRRWMAPEAASLTEALCFDLNAGVDPAVTERLKEIGTLHIVVASGMHVLLLAGALLYMLAGLPVPRPAQIAIVAFVLLLYCGATGLTPAVVRASLMALVGMSAYLYRREPDVLSALGLAGVFYLLWQPREVYDAGFQLSFLTVGGIALFYHPSRREPRWFVRIPHDAVKVSWIAFLASAPLLAYYFGTLSVMSLPANLLVGLAASAAVVSAFAAHALSLAAPPLGVGLLTVVTQPMAGWILWLSERLGGQAWSSVALPAFSPYWLTLVYGLLLLTWRPRIVQA